MGESPPGGVTLANETVPRQTTTGRATIVAPSSRVLDALGGDVGGDACIVVYL